MARLRFGVVLTGRGRDGARGLEAIGKRGGIAVAQDERSSEAFDMPLAARDIGRAELVLPLDRIAGALDALACSFGEIAAEAATRASIARGA